MWIAHALGSALAFFGGAIGGYVVAVALLGERRAPLILGLTLGFAVAGQAFALLWLPALLPAGWSSLLASAVMAGCWPPESPSRLGC